MFFGHQAPGAPRSVIVGQIGRAMMTMLIIKMMMLNMMMRRKKDCKEDEEVG